MLFWLFFQEKSREELETEILARFSDSVKQGLEVLDDAFITVEIKAEIGMLRYSVFEIQGLNPSAKNCRGNLSDLSICLGNTSAKIISNNYYKSMHNHVGKRPPHIAAFCRQLRS